MSIHNKITKLVRLLIIASIIQTNYVESRLVGVACVNRHGDRTPMKLYPKDPHLNSSLWYIGLGQLTNQGKRRLLDLGKCLRAKYAQLFDVQVYTNKLIYIQSDDDDRCLESAAVILAGMFPPKDRDVWNKYIYWNPFPIHTTKQSMDHVLGQQRNCPKYNGLLKQYIRSDEHKQIIRDSEPLMKYLRWHTGLDIRGIVECARLYDHLETEELLHLKLPEWTRSVYPHGNFRRLFIYAYFRVFGRTPELARLGVGFMFAEICENFQKIRNGTNEKQVFRLYSDHDTSISNFLWALGFNKIYEVPPYASCLLFELHEHVGRYYIQIYYKTSANCNFQLLSIPNCGASCPFDHFLKIYEPIIPNKSFEEECYYPPGDNLDYNTLILQI